ncbi:type I methionyl aminopeptidase [Candidatus Peregrinibacteria bacterium]|nr:type I methionyl aminopeptidase [Candidatus Peregrinibacteria bacterium]
MSKFQIFTPGEINSMRKAGKILRDCLLHTAKYVKPGITTLELDAIAEEFIRLHEGATPAFKGYRNYPFTLCTSVNDQCVHGLPSKRALKDGDIVALDCGVMVDRLYTDACISVGVGKVAPATETFLRESKAALDHAVAIIKPGVRIGDISSIIQTYVEGKGYSCMQALTGHGLGYSLHQFPDIPNLGKAGTGPVLPVNTVIAVEPITSMGEGAIRDEGDGWTISTKDGSLSAHYEHTVLVTEGGHEILA